VLRDKTYIEMKAVLLSGYHARSHHAWCERLESMFSDWQWHRFTLPPRHFSWRVRGSSLAFATEVPWEELNPDLVVATSMTDVASLRGMVPCLARVPVVLYVHENQFAYPNQVPPKGLVDWQLTSIYAALSSDVVIFNSDYNRRTFFEGARQLFKRLPDYAPVDLLDRLSERCYVIPVPLAPVENVASELVENLPSCDHDIVWNHRWEYDKGPDRLARIVSVLQQQQIDFRLHVVGEQFRESPPVFEEIRDSLQPRQRGLWGFLEDADYFSLLQRSDVVLSTAIHDFQGLSVLTGAQYGCRAVVPNRLAYPEWFDQCYLSTNEASDEEARDAVDLIVARDAKTMDVDYLSMVALAPKYRALLNQTVDHFFGEKSKN